MSKGKAFRNKRHRRESKAVIKFGKKAKATHSLRSGRTGQSHHKQLQNSLRGKAAKSNSQQDIPIGVLHSRKENGVPTIMSILKVSK